MATSKKTIKKTAEQLRDEAFEKLAKLKGGISREAWQALEKKYPDGIYPIIVEDKSVAIFKKPSRNELNCARALHNPNVPSAMYEELRTLTWIGGDEDLKDDEQACVAIELYMEHYLQLGKSISVLNL